MVREMFGQIAPTYDLLNSILSCNIHHRWRKAALDAAALRPQARVLDVATGTAELALAAQARGARVIGADFCRPLLERGAAKVHERQTPYLALSLGDAEHLPLSDRSFDAVLMAFALRNVTSPERAIAEMARVTAPGGWVVNLELTRPTNPVLATGYRFYQDVLMPAVGGLVSGQRAAYTYLPQSIQHFAGPETVARYFRSAGLVDVSFRPLSGGLATLHRGRRL